MSKLYQPAGKEVITGTGAVEELTLLSGATMVLITAETSSARYWLNGDNPSASEGHEILANDKEIFVGINMTNAKFYVASGAKLMVSYFE